MKLLYKLLHQDSTSREGIITTTSWLGIIVNAVIASLKIVLGLLTASVAIISEGANNATDALTSVLTLVGTKLAGKHPDAKHPFGYGRIEYLTGLAISVLITVTGIEMLLNSVRSIFSPEALSVSVISVAIVAASALIKLVVGLYTIKMGRKAGSTALEAVGIECRNDSIVSVVTIVSALVFVIFDFSLDAYAGIITSAIIIKAGIEVLRETISELLGRPGEHELAEKLYGKIRATEGVIGVADMMLHNYGPDSMSGSVNIEIDHKKTVGEVYRIIHTLQLDIMHEDNVTMVFGIYAVDNDGGQIKALRRDVAEFVRATEFVKSYHALFIEPDSDNIYCDFIVDYRLKDWEKLRRDFEEYMKVKYPDKNIRLTVETEYV